MQVQKTVFSILFWQLKSDGKTMIIDFMNEVVSRMKKITTLKTDHSIYRLYVSNK